MSLNEKPSLYLDDIAVGMLFCSRAAVITEERLKSFAQEFDPQPFHLDEEAAQNSLFAGLAASGWHTAAHSHRLFLESVPMAKGMVGAGVELSWPTPTRAGDWLRVESRVKEIIPSRSKPDRAIVIMESQTLNQADAVVLKMLSRIVMFKRDSDSPAVADPV